MAFNERFWHESEKHDLNMLYRLVGTQQPDGMIEGKESRAEMLRVWSATSDRLESSYTYILCHDTSIGIFEVTKGVK